jgi:hypothetical protein
MTNKFLIIIAAFIQEYKDKSGENRFVAIREIINNSNETTIFLLNLLTSFRKPTMVNLIEHIEENSDFYPFNLEDKKITAIILIYRYYNEINLELKTASDEYMLEVTTDCIGYYSLNQKKIQNNNSSSSSREIEIKDEKSPVFLIIGLIILAISIYFAQDQSRYNDMKGSLVGLGVLIGVFTTLGGFFYYKSD